MIGRGPDASVGKPNPYMATIALQLVGLSAAECIIVVQQVALSPFMLTWIAKPKAEFPVGGI